MILETRKKGYGFCYGCGKQFRPATLHAHGGQTCGRCAKAWTGKPDYKVIGTLVHDPSDEVSDDTIQSYWNWYAIDEEVGIKKSVHL